MTSAQSPHARWLKYFVIACMIALSLVLAKQFNLSSILQQALQQALAWVDRQGPLAPVAFILIYNVATVLLIPGSVLTLGSGILFGAVWGTIYVVIAATLGATFAFWIGRNFARGWVSRQIAKYPKFAAIDRAVAQEGFKIVTLTRLSPLFPFNLLNYAFGITQVSLRDYVLGSIGMVPGTILYVYLGSLVGSLAMIGSTTRTDPQTAALQWAVKIVGLVATVTVSIYITRIARRALDQSIAE